MPDIKGPKLLFQDIEREQNFIIKDSGDISLNRHGYFRPGCELESDKIFHSSRSEKYRDLLGNLFVRQIHFGGKLDDRQGHSFQQPKTNCLNIQQCLLHIGEKRSQSERYNSSIQHIKKQWSF